MTTINQLARADSLSAGDLLVIWSASNSDARSAAISVLLSYLQSNLTPGGSFETQYFAPSATGFSVTVAPTTAGNNVHLLMTPVADYAAGTVTLPAVATCVDKQEVLISSTHAVTTLTISGNGATAVNGAPTTLSANGFARLKYDAVNTSWYRIG